MRYTTLLITLVFCTINLATIPTPEMTVSSFPWRMC